MTKQDPQTMPRSAVTEKIELGLAKRHRRENIFRAFGLTAVIFGFILVFFLLFDITSKALPAFHQHWVKVDVNYSEKSLRYAAGDNLADLSYRNTLRKSIYETFPEVKARRDKRQLNGLFSSNAEFAIKEHLIANPDHLGTTQPVWVRVDDDVDVYLKEVEKLGEPLVRIDQKEAQWIKTLVDNGTIEKRFNIEFFTSSDSRSFFSSTILTYNL